MSGEESLQKTALHKLHVDAGGRMVSFAGWHLPVQYSGVMDEHRAVRNKAGLFDVSHMGEVAVRGPQALDYLQHMTCNDVARLKPGRAQYSALTTPEGGFVDDLLIYMREEQDYLLVINAANTSKDVAWLRRHTVGYDVVAEDVSGEWMQLALQGPAAEAILQQLVAEPLSELKYYRFRQTDVCGERCIVSRTGYTGEDGFEIYGPRDHGPRVWNALISTGQGDGLVPVGLAARDTLRLEAKMALYGNDIDETTSVLEADLGWIVKLGKGDFIGRDSLAQQKEEGIQRKLVGFEMRGRAIARRGHRAMIDGREIGQITSGTFAPFLGKSIGLAYLPIESSDPGTEFAVEIRGREQPTVVVTTPFYKRAR